MVKDVSSLETTSKGSKKLDVLLVDDRSARTSIHTLQYTTYILVYWPKQIFRNILKKNSRVSKILPRNHDMVISLWEEKATHFMESMAPLQDAAVFVIITGLLAKQYSGKHYSKNFTNAVSKQGQKKIKNTIRLPTHK